MSAWTIYFRDGSSEIPAVHPGHNRPDYPMWKRVEVVSTDDYAVAVDLIAALRGAREITAEDIRSADKLLRANGYDPIGG